MVRGITDNLEEKLSKFIGTNAIIMQNGFIECEYLIEN